MRKITNNFLGWVDDEVKTTEHDKIMLWLDENIEDVVKSTQRSEWTEEQIKWAKQSSPEFKEPLPSKPEIKIIKKTWEYSISKDKIPIGFVDLLVEAEIPHLHLSSTMRDFKWEVYSYKTPLGFEVKSQIKSLGEVIRQIRLYKLYLDIDFFVVSPDCRYVKTLKEQGVGFIKYYEE